MDNYIVKVRFKNNGAKGMDIDKDYSRNEYSCKCNIPVDLDNIVVVQTSYGLQFAAICGIEPDKDGSNAKYSVLCVVPDEEDVFI